MRPAPRRTLVSWALLAVVVGVALGVGASRPAEPVGPAARAAAIDAVVRCPSCDGISVAQSSAPTAVAVRQAVLARVRAGESDARVEAFLVGRYGPDILLRPPARGGTLWVWVLPPVALAAGAAGVGAVLWRRRRPGPQEVSAEDRALVERALVERALVERALVERARDERARVERATDAVAPGGAS